jgi:hypothetical protein
LRHRLKYVNACRLTRGLRLSTFFRAACNPEDRDATMQGVRGIYAAPASLLYDGFNVFLDIFRCPEDGSFPLVCLVGGYKSLTSTSRLLSMLSFWRYFFGSVSIGCDVPLLCDSLAIGKWSENIRAYSSHSLGCYSSRIKLSLNYSLQSVPEDMSSAMSSVATVNEKQFRSLDKSNRRFPSEQLFSDLSYT